MKPFSFLRDAVRAKEIVATLASNGFAEFLNETELPVGWLGKLVPQNNPNFTIWERIRFVCEELGPTFVKAGQVLASRADILPQPLIEELKHLRNNVRPEPPEKIRAVLDAEIKGSVDEFFTDFDPEPVACGSIAQVHRARLKSTGQWVGLKIQRPGIESQVSADMEILGWLARQLHQRVSALKPWDLPSVIEELRDSLVMELNFTNEARNIALFNARNPFPNEVFSPRVIDEFTSRRLLVTEWVDGVSVDSFSGTVEERQKLAHFGAKSIFYQIIVDGFFHADPHGGNILITTDGKVCLIDWGAAGQLTRKNRYDLADLFNYVVEQDVEGVARTARSMSKGAQFIDEQKLEKEVAAAINRYGPRPPQDLIGKVIFDLLYVFAANGVNVARDYLLLAKAVTCLTETAQHLDPQFNLATAAEPFLKKLGWERWNPASLATRAFWKVSDAIHKLNDLPGDLQRLLRRFEREDLKIHLHHQNLEYVTEEATAAINRLVLAIIAASLIVGSSLVIRANVPPFIWGNYSAIGVFGYLSSVVLGFWIVFDIIRHGRHKGPRR